MDNTKSSDQIKGDLSKAGTQKDTPVEMSHVQKYLAMHPEIEQAQKDKEVEKKQLISQIKDQYDLANEQFKSLKTDMELINNPAANIDPALRQQITKAYSDNAMSRISLMTKMNGVISDAATTPPAKKAPGTITIGDGDKSMDIDENKLNRMMTDPQYMQDQLQAMPPKYRDEFQKQLGVNAINDGLSQPSAAPGQPQAPINPVPSQQVGGEDALKSTIKNFITQFGTAGVANQAGQTVSNIANNARSATRKGI